MNRQSRATAYISSTTALFEKQEADSVAGIPDVTVYPEATRQTIQGFGGAFNEKGWQALEVLGPKERLAVMRALFDREAGLGLTLCRVPIGASDYALDRYTLNETAGDHEMKHFSIDRDRKHLIPFVKEAMSIQPKLRLWGSAWTPPTWMKDNKAFDSGNFLDDPKMYASYARYLLKFVETYRAEGLPIEAVAVQNEPGTLTLYPSCDWTPTQYLTFIRDHFGPLFRAEAPDVRIMLGTFNQPNLVGHALTVLADQMARQFVDLGGMQWYAIAFMDTLKAFAPGLEVWQTETDCGNWHWLPGWEPDRAPNDIRYALFTWDRLRAWFASGVTAYALWNMVLDPQGFNLDSLRPWPQNAPITVDPASKAVRYTPMFGAFGSFSRFVPPGSVMVETEGNYTDAVAFRDPTDRIVTVLCNQQSVPVTLKAGVRRAVHSVELPPLSFGTLVVEVE